MPPAAAAAAAAAGAAVEAKKWDESEETEEVSVFQLKALPSFEFTLGGTVIRLPDVEGQDVPDARWAGQVIKIDKGYVHVRWSDGSVCTHGPHQLYPVDEDGMQDPDDAEFDFEDDVCMDAECDDPECPDHGEYYEGDEGEHDHDLTVNHADDEEDEGEEEEDEEEGDEEEADEEEAEDVEPSNGNVVFEFVAPGAAAMSEDDDQQNAVVGQEPAVAALAEEGKEGEDEGEAFAVVEAVPDNHWFKTRAQAVAQPSKSWSKRVAKEWKGLQKGLPAGVFVRVFEDRMDLLQAVIVGAEGTPYNRSVFLFDIVLPSDYPARPPELHYHAYGMRLNPNLYVDGKVCLSLLNTWMGKSSQRWRPDESTLLQVLVSVQGLVLGQMDPYYLEAGYEKQRGTPNGLRASIMYNETALVYSLQLLQHQWNSPPLLFAAAIKAHVRASKPALAALAAYPFEEVREAVAAAGDVDFAEQVQDESDVAYQFGIRKAQAYLPSKGFLATLKPVLAKLLAAIPE